MFVNVMAFDDLLMQGYMVCDAIRLHLAVAIDNGYMMCYFQWQEYIDMFNPRPVLALGYCHCLHLCVGLSICQCCVCQS